MKIICPSARSVQAATRIVLFALSLLSLLFSGGASAPRSAPALPAMTAPQTRLTSCAPTAQTGLASYYGERYQGRTTASGEIFDMNKLTAAHRSLPFGVVVRVTNPANNRSVVVRINDRGPYVGDRIIDLSLAAARQLDMVVVGVTQVRMERVDAKGPPVAGVSRGGDELSLARLLTGDQRDRALP